MTDRLSELMQREAAALDVPPPPTARVVARGHGLRRRRRLTTGAAVLSALAVVGSGIVLTSSFGRGDDAVDPALHPDHPTVDVGAVFSIGSTVYLDGGAVSATIADPVAFTVMLTSAGVVVQGYEPDGEGDGQRQVTFVGPDGATRDLSVPGGAALATDASQPLLAWAEEVDDVMTAVVHDVVTDEDLARVAIPEHTGGFGEISIDGEFLYLNDGADTEDMTDNRVFAVDWRSGEVADSEFVNVSGGRAVGRDGRRPTVVDVETGETLLTLDQHPNGSLALSPDGRYAKYLDPSSTEPTSTDVYEVDSGAKVTVPGASYDYGWTADGQLVSVSDEGELRTCSPTTGECRSQQLDLDVLPDERSQEAVEPIYCELLEGDSEVCSTFPPDDYSDDLRLAGTGGSY